MVGETIDKDKPESEAILEIKQGECYVRIPRKKNDIELIKKILEVFEEVEDPEPVSPEPPEPKPKRVQKKPGSKPGPKPSRKIKRAQFRYPDGMRNFCIKNIDKMKNQELIESINKEFDLDMDYNRLASYLKYNNIRRSKSSSKKKDLPTLPPPDY